MSGSKRDGFRIGRKLRVRKTTITTEEARKTRQTGTTVHFRPDPAIFWDDGALRPQGRRRPSDAKRTPQSHGHDSVPRHAHRRRHRPSSRARTHECSPEIDSRAQTSARCRRSCLPSSRTSTHGLSSSSAGPMAPMSSRSRSQTASGTGRRELHELGLKQAIVKAMRVHEREGRAPKGRPSQRKTSAKVWSRSYRSMFVEPPDSGQTKGVKQSDARGSSRISFALRSRSGSPQRNDCGLDSVNASSLRARARQTRALPRRGHAKSGGLIG